MVGLPHVKGSSITADDVESTSDGSSEKASHGFKIETDKVSQPICVHHYGPLQLIAFALVNRQLKLYEIKQTVAKLAFEQRAQVRTDQMAVCMSINTHKVSERLLICMGL